MDDEYYKRQNRSLGTCVAVLLLAVVGLGGYVAYVVVERQRADAVGRKAVEDKAYARLVRIAALERELLSLLGQVRLVEVELEGKRRRLEMSENVDAGNARSDRRIEDFSRLIRDMTTRARNSQARILDPRVRLEEGVEPTPPIQPVRDSPETKRLRAEVAQVEADLLRVKTREEEVRRRLRDE